MVLASKKIPSILIVFFITLLIGAPLLAVLLVIPLCLYVYVFKNGDFTPVLNHLERINSAKLLIAGGLTFASMAIYQSANYITHLGFPFPFITYYNLPVTDQTIPFWNKLAVNGLGAGLNIFIYAMLLNLIGWVYRQSTLRLGKS